MRAILAVVLLLVGVMTTPATLAEPDVVDRCSRDCTPGDVNDGPSKAGRESVDVILYAHINNLLEPIPLNTQPPGPHEEPGRGFGYLMPSINTDTGVCGPVMNACADLHYENNRVTMFLSPGRVEVLSAGSWGTLGLYTASHRLDLTGAPLRLFWYMSTDAADADGLALGAGAGLRLSAWAETGPLGGAGRVIAASRLDHGVSTTPMFSLPDGQRVYEFEVPLHVDQRALAGADPLDGIKVIVEWKQVDAGNLAQAAQADWRVHAGPRFMPRLVVPMYEPITEVDRSMTHHDGGLFLRWSIQPVFGSYDVDDASLRIDVVESPLPFQPLAEYFVLRRSMDCWGHLQPVNMTWKIEYRERALPDGHYKLRASILNLQESYLAATDFEFDVRDGIPDGAARFEGTAELPGFELTGLVAALALATLAAARRRP